MVESLVLATASGSVGSYGSLYTPLSDVSQVRSRAHARVAAHRFKRMLVFDRRSDGLAHVRDAARVRTDGNDHLSIHFLIRGGLVGGPLGERREVKPGQLLLFDTSQAMWSQAVRAHYVTIWIARDQIDRRIGDLRAFGGAVLPADASGLLGDFMRAMSRRAAALPDSVAEGASRVMGDLIAATLSGDPRPASRAVPDEVGAVLRQERIEAYIMARLNDPTLNVQEIGAGTGLSRASVYRAFKEVGGVAQFIQTRRLLAVRDALRRAGEARSFSSLAYAHGFTSESHCSRLFGEMFDTSPGRFRTRMREARSSPALDGPPMGRLAHWRSELY